MCARFYGTLRALRGDLKNALNIDFNANVKKVEQL